MKSIHRRLWTTMFLPVALFILWYVFSADSKNFFFPSLNKILKAFDSSWLNAGGMNDIFASLWRLVVGFAASFVFALVAGVLLGSSKVARDYSEPVFEFFRAIPPTVMIPVLLVISGIGDTSKIAVISFGCLWPMLLNTIEGVRSIDPVLKDTCRVYQIQGLRRLFALTLPAASPQIITGMRTGLSIAIILMVISEMFASRNGIGFTIIQFQRTFAIPEMWSGILLLGLIGVALSLIMRIFEMNILSWYEGSRERS
jgi:ABC-type nitrate/sulfonate/bicarbonate transport system permease component